MKLMTNRYGLKSPTAIQESGVSISCPLYITLTSDQKKLLLNTFRQIKTEQKTTLSEEQETAIERELGMNEESKIPTF